MFTEKEYLEFRIKEIESRLKENVVEKHKIIAVMEAQNFVHHKYKTELEDRLKALNNESQQPTSD